MTWFDGAVLAVVAVSTAIGLVRGLVKEVLSLIAWIAAFAIASGYAADAAPWLPDAIPDGAPRLVVAFAALFVAVLIGAALVNWTIALIIAALGLKVVDRGLGALFGFARGVLVVVTLVLVAGVTGLPRQPFWRDALLAPVVEATARTVRPWLPQPWAERLPDRVGSSRTSDPPRAS